MKKPYKKLRSFHINDEEWKYYYRVPKYDSQPGMIVIFNPQKKRFEVEEWGDIATPGTVKKYVSNNIFDFQ